MRPLASIVAHARGNVIGASGSMPWHVPEDLKYFKRLTSGHAIVMGRKTFASIGRPLPARRNLVVSRSVRAIEGCEVFATVDDALEAAYATDPCPFVIGGAQIYAATLTRITDLYVTKLDRDVEGDAFFPDYETLGFELVTRTAGETEGVTFEHLRRSTPRP